MTRVEWKGWTSISRGDKIAQVVSDAGRLLPNEYAGKTITNTDCRNSCTVVTFDDGTETRLFRHGPGQRLPVEVGHE